jgi:hypothetical protein
MKVSINSPKIDGAYGGGKTFIQQLTYYFRNEDIAVINHLHDSDINIILIVNVTYTYSYNFYKAQLYKLHHPEVIIVHRVNDSGYQRKDGLMTNLMTLCSYKSDHLVYVSSWLQKEMLPKMKTPIPSSVILNGIDIDSNILLPKVSWDGKSKLKIVTHHWSNNYDKGHDFYQAFDRLLDCDDFKDKYEFTYIGNYPKNLEYRNTNLLITMKKNELKNEIRKNHIYLTGSKNEAAGYHVIEGISLGLPILFYDSGGIPEYAKGYGIKFTENDFEDKLKQIRKEYFNLLPLVSSYDFSGESMSKQYLSLFENLIDNQKISLATNNRIVDSYITKYSLLFKDISFKFYKFYYPILSSFIKRIKE